MTSNFKGVSWHKEKMKWAVDVYLGGGRRVSGGYFHCEIDAAEAFDTIADNYNKAPPRNFKERTSIPERMK
jgi:hypothetical protein